MKSTSQDEATLGSEEIKPMQIVQLRVAGGIS